MTVFSLYIIIAPNGSPDGELLRPTKTQSLAAIRQLKRLNTRLDRLVFEDHFSTRYVASAIRKKNIVRGKPRIVNEISLQALLELDVPAHTGIVLLIPSATQFLLDTLGFVPIMDELTMIQLEISGDSVQLRSLVQPLMRL